MLPNESGKVFPSLAEFEFLETKPLGKGSFGQVKLALHIKTNQIYALKIVSCLFYLD